jgi:ACS family hexuronate transporter-like MFS transporter
MPFASSRENRTVFLLALAFGFVFFDRNALNFLAPMLVSELALTNLQVGMLSSGLSLTWAVSGFWIAMLADAKGRRTAYLAVCVLAFSLCSFVSGLAVSFLTLLLARMAMGLAEGPILPIAQSVMLAESSPHRRGLNMGILQSLGAAVLGGFAAPLLLVGIAEVHGWRTAFFVAGIPGVLLSLVLWKTLREPAAQDAKPAAGKPERPPVLWMLKQRNMWVCVLVSCCMVAWLVIGLTFLPLYYTQVRQMSSGDMSKVMAALGVAAALFGAFIGPGLSDRFGRKPVVFAMCALALLSPLSALYYEGPLPGLVALAFLGWAGAGAMPIVMATVPGETLPPRFAATAIGLTQGIGEIVGGVVAPVVAGRVADLAGLGAAMQIQAGCVIAALVFSLGLIETAPRHARARHGAAAVGLKEANT